MASAAASGLAPPPLAHPSPAALFGCAPLHARRPGRWPSVLCMARPRRVEMVAKQIRRELGDMLLKDKVLLRAVLPEVGLGADRYLSSLTTISDVKLSRDLQVAKVYVSVYGDERGKEIVMEGLKAKAKYLRSGLGKRLSLRLAPEVRFILDDSLERGSRVLAILDKLKEEREGKEAGAKQNGDYAFSSEFGDKIRAWEEDLEEISGSDGEDTGDGKQNGDYAFSSEFGDKIRAWEEDLEEISGSDGEDTGDGPGEED